MMNRGELEVTFGCNKRCVHDIRYSQVHEKIIDRSPVELEIIFFSFKSGKWPFRAMFRTMLMGEIVLIGKNPFDGQLAALRI